MPWKEVGRILVKLDPPRFWMLLWLRAGYELLEKTKVTRRDEKPISADSAYFCHLRIARCVTMDGELNQWKER